MTDYTFPDCNRYFQKDLEKLRYKFNGAESIKNNYSQAFQDMFVLSILLKRISTQSKLIISKLILNLPGKLSMH